MYYIDMEDRENFVKSANKDSLPVWAYDFDTKEEAIIALVNIAFDKVTFWKKECEKILQVFHSETEYLKSKKEYERSLQFFDSVVEYVKTKILTTRGTNKW